MDLFIYVTNTSKNSLDCQAHRMEPLSTQGRPPGTRPRRVAESNLWSILGNTLLQYQQILDNPSKDHSTIVPFTF